MKRPGKLLALCVLAGLVQLSCVPAGIPVDASPDNGEIVSSMRPLTRTCGSSDRDDETPSAADPETRAKLYWVGECDEILVRWTKLSFPDPEGGRTNICNPPPRTSIRDTSTVSLVRYPGAMLGAGVIHASYSPGHSGCEQASVRITAARPPNVVPDGDYVLQLFAGTEAQIDEAVLARRDPSSAASLTIARVGRERKMQPRPLVAEGCEPSSDGTDPCEKRKYKYTGIAGDEHFGPNIRVSRIRILMGRKTEGRLEGIEGEALRHLGGFECARDDRGECAALPFEWVQATSNEHRCSIGPAATRPEVDLKTDCASPVDATPVALLSGAYTSIIPTWSVNFKATTGFPPPGSSGFPPLEDPDFPPSGAPPDLAIEFTLVTLP